MRVLLCSLGQSNELGPGGDINARVGYGHPLVEPTRPNGAGGSWWPHLVDLMARRGVIAHVYNAAVGGTSICGYWTGCCRTYVSGMVVNAGSYVLSGGKIWKCTDPDTTGTASGGVATVTPSGSVGADNVQWQDQGTPTAEDVAGAVYAEGSPRFDPNGALAGIVSGTLTLPGYDEKIVTVSIGQGDKTLASTAAMFSQAYQNVAAYFTSRGYKVALGFTCYGNTSGLDAWYSAELLPGRLAALTALSSNRNVFLGANLRESLGVLAVTPATGPGLQADALHMNYLAMSLAAAAWDTALQNAGY
jgi:hypothetical protein